MRRTETTPSKRRARWRCALVVAPAMALLASCDLTADGSHQALASHHTCRDVTLTHSRTHVEGTSTLIWESGTSDYHFACSGVSARLRYRWTDGRFYENEWVWGAVSAWSTNRGAIASPAAEHQICASSSDCAHFEN
jgi:hypothetical protein